MKRLMLKQKSYTRITLALDIIQKLNKGSYKGYHELNIIKHQIDLYDTITITPAEKMGISCDKPDVPLNESNLCWKAADLLKKECSISENIHIALQKSIPVKGGLAGGSANAATVLDMLNKYWNLNLNTDQLRLFGRRIGMDVPFYFIGGTAFDTESTGILEPVSNDLVFDFICVIPDFGVSTKYAYQDIDYSRIAENKNKTALMKEALQNSEKDTVISLMHNDFELSVFRKYPALKELRDEMKKMGCVNAVMSGSGSTLIGVAKDREHALWVKERVLVSSVVVSSILGRV